MLMENDVCDVDDVMMPYVLHCIEDWQDVPGDLRLAATRVLPPGIIADNEYDARKTVSARYHDRGNFTVQFIPMPTCRERTGFFFFAPLRRFSRDGMFELSFELIWTDERDKCLAFRFEPGDTGRHSYSHVQMCKKLRGWTTAVLGLPQWIRDSYPAFPSAAKSPVEMFLSMATAVHGYRNGGMRDVLTEIFQNNNRVLLGMSYLKILDQLLVN